MEQKGLKPCPFCGGEARLMKYYKQFSRRVTIQVRCTNCRANGGDWGRTDKAIEAWNRRAE